MSGGMELYLHMPFCVRKCAYCDFLSFPSGAKTQRMYAKRLMEDIGVMGKRYGEIPVETIFIGGGTPSVPWRSWNMSDMRFMSWMARRSPWRRIPGR